MANSIKENADQLQRLKEAGLLKPALPAPPAAFLPPIPPAEPALNPLSRGPLPASWGHSTDIARQWHMSAIPQTRILPLPSTANPVVGAQAASQAAIVSAAAIAAIPVTTGGVTSVGLSMPSIFVSPVSGSPITSAGTLAPTFIAEPPNKVFAGPPSSAGNIPLDSFGVSSGTVTVTVSASTSQANDFVVFVSESNAGPTHNPTGGGGTWTVIDLGTGGNGSTAAYATIPSAGAFTVSQIFAAGNWVAAVASFTSTSSPVVKQSKTSGFQTPITLNSNTVAGSTIVVTVAGGQTVGEVYSITDSQSNTYQQITSPILYNSSGEQATIFAATGTTAAALTVTLSFVLGGISPTPITWTVTEVANLAPISPNIPTFRSLVTNDIPGMQQGTLDLAHGGTQADLSATGGTGQFLKQAATGTAITVVQPDYSDFAGVNAATKYRNISTASRGLVAEYASINLTAQAAAITSTLLFTAPAFGAGGGGTYRITWSAEVTTAATTSSTLGGAAGFQLIYTDQDDSVSVTTPAWWDVGNNGAAPTSASLNTTQTYIGGTLIINAISNQAVNYLFGYTSSGATAMQYNLHIRVEAL